MERSAPVITACEPNRLRAAPTFDPLRFEPRQTHLEPNSNQAQAAHKPLARALFGQCSSPLDVHPSSHLGTH